MGFGGRPRSVAVSGTSGEGGAAAVLPLNRPLPLISRLWFGARVRPRLQSRQQYAERGRSNGALPPATLAAEEDGGS